MTSRSNLTLYAAVDALGIIDEWIEEHLDEILANGGELPPALAELIDQATAQLEGKVEKVALKVREILATAAAVKAEADRLAQRHKTLENTATALKAYLKLQLERAKVAKVEGQLATVALQRNSTPSVTFAGDATKLPEAWRKVYTPPPPPPAELDSKKALEIFKARQDLAKDAPIPPALEFPEGVSVAVGTHIRIR